MHRLEKPELMEQFSFRFYLPLSLNSDY